MTTDEAEVRQLHAEISRALDAVLQRHVAALEQDLERTIEHYAQEDLGDALGDALVRTLTLSVTRDVLMALMLNAIDLDGEPARHLCQQIIERLQLHILAPPTRMH